MKRKMTILMMVLAAQCGLAANLFAATGVREDSSMLMVWALVELFTMLPPTNIRLAVSKPADPLSAESVPWGPASRLRTRTRSCAR